MTPTTQLALKESFRTTILGISPTFSEHQDHGWRYTPSPHEVPGPILRIFTILTEPADPDPPETSVFGGGISYTFTMQVVASYGRLPIGDADPMIDEDKRDLWLALADVGDGGLIDVSFPTWEESPDSEDGNVWGFFEFEIRYFGRNI